MRAWRQAAGTSHPCPKSSSRAGCRRASRRPEARSARPGLGDPFGSRHLLQRLAASLSASPDVEREAAPGARLGAHLARRKGPRGVSPIGSSSNGRRLASPRQPSIDQAHRHAAGSPAGSGGRCRRKKIALISSDLPRREGSATKATTSFRYQVARARRRSARQPRRGRGRSSSKACERLRPFAQRGAPAAEGVETGGE